MVDALTQKAGPLHTEVTRKLLVSDGDTPRPHHCRKIETASIVAGKAFFGSPGERMLLTLPTASM
jgi:hypothetical protein